MKNKKFKISVIVPIYNVEQYLEECIESVIHQTIGFEDNIQLILVNDGSPDNSEKICLKYKRKYPNNVIYISQVNAGVSAARNKGLEYATAEIVNFLDSDDIWEKDVFVKAYDMLSANDDVDIVGVRLKFFDGMEGYHALDYKFDRDKIVDISVDYNHIQLSSASCFIRRKAISNNKFDTRLKYSEDVKFVSEILLNKMKLGIISSSLYLYRRRVEETSAIQTKSSNESWYIDTPKLCYKYLFDLSIKKYGYVIPYIQYCVMYDYQWRVKDDIPVNISKNVINEYIKIYRELLKKIDCNIILEQKKLSIEYKILLLKEKLGKSFYDHFVIDNGSVYFDGLLIHRLSNKHLLTFTTLKVKNGKLVLKGLINSILDKKDYDIIFKIDDEEEKLNLFDTKIHVRNFFNKEVFHEMGFTKTIDISGVSQISIYIRYDNQLLDLVPSFSIFGKLNDKIPLNYIHGGFSLSCKSNVIRIRKSNAFKDALSRVKLLVFLLKRFKVKIVLYRLCYHFYHLFKRKKIWLISDRTAVANDNGMHLYKYIVQHNKTDDVYFVLSRDSKDYEKMRKIGKVLNYGSFKYKIYFLLSSYVVSSQADIWVYNPFNKNCKYYMDLYNFDFIFLQHGITKDDISDWLNVYRKDFSLFITAAKDEYSSIINNADYGYGSDVVKLTGFPRYDNLVDKSIKQIAIMPTWRKSIAGLTNEKTGLRDYSEKFINTEYYKFYNSLINDERLLTKMKDKGYTGVFVVHPLHIANSIDFKGNEVFEVISDFADYQKVFKESSLLVSDFSSVPFDFAYMKKPVVYTQFDIDTFFGGHLYNEGYFSYKKNGFGPVCYDYDSSVDAIIKYIENDCVMEDKYKNRVDHFFCYTDKNNCKRVYEEILKLSDNTKKTKK